MFLGERSLNCFRDQFKLRKSLNCPKEQPCALGSKDLSFLGKQSFLAKQMCLELCLIVTFAYEF
jgi:hypothetical protein